MGTRSIHRPLAQQGGKETKILEKGYGERKNWKKAEENSNDERRVIGQFVNVHPLNKRRERETEILAIFNNVSSSVSVRSLYCVS